MNNLDEIKEELISLINELPSIKRLHELEDIIDNNSLILEKFNKLKLLQKMKVNSDYYKKNNAALEYSLEIDKIKEEISDIPFVDEYLDLLEEAYCLLKNITNIMASEINKNIQ